MSHSASRTYDLVIFGATGFTGQLVAEYLVGRLHETPGLRLALAGRNRDKLEKTRTALSALSGRPEIRELPLLVADAQDVAALDRLVPTTRVIATTAGPFALFGRELLAACARHGTHYCDLTGETHFVRDMIDQHHDAAVASGAKLVPCCGFDSIPSDLGVLMLQEHQRTRHGGPCKEVRFFLEESRGGVSGGTIKSGLLLAEEARRDPRVRKILADPYALDPSRSGGQSDGADGRDQLGVRWDPELKQWTGPFVMAAINTRVVRRSNALLDYAYGRDFRYSEATACGAGPLGFLTAAGLAAGTGLFVGVGATGPGRAVLSRLLPKPGEGPSQAARDKGRFTIRLLGRGTSASGGTVHLSGEVRGQKDPGYGETAKMLGEAALCLCRDEAELPRRGGVLTPASAMGMTLLSRLRRAGMTFSVEEV